MATRSPMMQLVRNWVLAFVTPRPLVGALYLPRYFRDWRRYSALARTEMPRWKDSYPCLTDWTPSTPFDPHYFFQGAWLARQVAQRKPDLHVDIASSVLTVSVLSATVETLFVDYRPLQVRLPGLHSVTGTLLNLPFKDRSIASLSCLHVIEHVGLGRYGDPIDPEGSRKAVRELERVVAPGGRLYISVPVGRERVCFNGHRIFSPRTIRDWLGALALEKFALVDDEGRFDDGASDELLTRGGSQDYGCGLFLFRRV